MLYHIGHQSCCEDRGLTRHLLGRLAHRGEPGRGRAAGSAAVHLRQALQRGVELGRAEWLPDAPRLLLPDLRADPGAESQAWMHVDGSVDVKRIWH